MANERSAKKVIHSLYQNDSFYWKGISFGTVAKVTASDFRQIIYKVVIVAVDNFNSGWVFFVIGATVEDDKVSTDLVEEKIMEFEDEVQSVDIVAFNKL